MLFLDRLEEALCFDPVKAMKSKLPPCSLNFLVEDKRNKSLFHLHILVTTLQNVKENLNTYINFSNNNQIPFRIFGLW